MADTAEIERRLDEQSRRYMPDRGKDRHECLICGALVVERFIHADWHDRLERQVQSASMGMMAHMFDGQEGRL